MCKFVKPFDEFVNNCYLESSYLQPWRPKRPFRRPYFLHQPHRHLKNPRTIRLFRLFPGPPTRGLLWVQSLGPNLICILLNKLKIQIQKTERIKRNHRCIFSRFLRASLILSIQMSNYSLKVEKLTSSASYPFPLWTRMPSWMCQKLGNRFL